ncbi:MAG: hypothetical protein V4582_13550 [Pseudomonadota bacterium]
MNKVNPSPAAGTSIPGDDDVHWFGASRRLVGGKPDSRYGWLDTAQGPAIVKALDPSLSAHAATLLQHERAMLRRLRQLDAPAPALVEVGRPDWIVTRFAGLSLQCLEQGAGFGGRPARRFPFAERLAAWVHLLRRLQGLADSGVLAIDIYHANVVLPLTEGCLGQLRLHEAALIDHAHTLDVGMHMRRPVWLDHGMARIAPELRAALQDDQQALIDSFRAAHADLPGASAVPGARDEHNRRVWAEYDAPQQLQRLLDAGDLNPGRAMQFAAATGMARMLGLADSRQQAQALARVLARMTAPAAADRYATLTAAADALAGVLPALPLVSQHRYAPVQPHDLACGADASQTPAVSAGATAGAPAPDISVTPVPGAAPALDARERATDFTTQFTSLASAAGAHAPMRWICALAAIGAAAGAAWPLA